MKGKKIFLGTLITVAFLLAIILVLNFYDEILKKSSTAKPNNTIPIVASDSFIDSVGKPVVLIDAKVRYGTGSFYSQEGKFVRIMTCKHIVENAGEINIHFNGKVYPAIVIGTDSFYDIAALQIEVPEDFHAPIVKFGNSKLQKDEFVVVCGYNRIIVEEKLRVKTIRLGLLKETPFYPLLSKTDVPVCKGNSGAPLFNFKGEVVGIIRLAIFPELPHTPALINSVESFAIPINIVKEFLSSLPKPSEVEKLNQ